MIITQLSLSKVLRKEIQYLIKHSTIFFFNFFFFIYYYFKKMVIWQMTTQIATGETHNCHLMVYFQIVEEEIAQWVHHEGWIQQPITP